MTDVKRMRARTKPFELRERRIRGKKSQSTHLSDNLQSHLK